MASATMFWAVLWTVHGERFVYRADLCNSNANSSSNWEGGGGTMAPHTRPVTVSFGAVGGSVATHVDVLLEGQLSAGGGLYLDVSSLVTRWSDTTITFGVIWTA